MTVFQDRRRGNRWSYEFELGKQRYQGVCIDPETGALATSRRQALEIETLRKRAARQQHNIERSGLRADAYTLNQAAVLYLLRKEGKSDFANHLRYVREIRQFPPFADGSKALVDITEHHCEEFRRHAGGRTLRKWIGGQRKPSGTPADERFWRDTGKPRSRREVNNHLKCLRALLAIGERVRDPVTRLPVLEKAPEVRLHRLPKRIPRPISDAELHARLDRARPWTREAAELARLFGLRLSEAVTLQRHHIDRDMGGLRFRAGDTKSGNEELAHGGAAGWRLLLELDAQAEARGQSHLVTWPGTKLWRAWLRGESIAATDWRPLASIRRSWATTARAAAIDDPHRFHDVRARFVTEVAKVMPAAAQDAARHQDPATTARYIKLASSEIRAAVDQATARRPPAPTRLKVVK